MRLLLLLLLSVASVVRAAPRLTAQRCPAACGARLCLLYDAASASSCRRRVGCSRHDCASIRDLPKEDGITQPRAVAFRCVAPSMRTPATWTLDVESAPSGDAPTRNLTYPDAAATITSVVIRGGAGVVTLDESVLATPASVTAFYVSDIRVPSSLLGSASLAGRQWEQLTLESTGLDSVPAALSVLPLRTLNLANNKISTLPDDLNLPPLLTSLNLSGNPLATIPRAVFRLSALSTLALRHCNLTNVHVTLSELAFLRQLETLDADLTVSHCVDGAVVTSVHANGDATVCVRGAAPMEVRALSTDGGGSDQTVLIVVIVVGVVVVVVLLAVGYWFCCRAQDKKAHNEYQEDGGRVPKPRQPPSSFAPTIASLDFVHSTYGWDDDKDEDMFLADASAFGGSAAWSDPNLLVRRIDRDDILLLRRMDSDTLTETWLGQLETYLAVKKLAASHRHPQLADALATRTSEVLAIFAAAGVVTHPNLVELVGVTWTKMETFAVASLYSKGGDLRSLLASTKPLTWEDTKCQLAIDVADALVFLETHERVAAPTTAFAWILSSDHVFINAQGTAQLDIVQLSPATVLEKASDSQSLRYVAPEVLAGGKATASALVYSFGVLLCELDTRSRPFDDVRNPDGSKTLPAVIIARIRKGELRPMVSAGCPERIAELVSKCLSVDPSARPTAQRIAYELRAIQKEEF